MGRQISHARCNVCRDARRAQIELAHVSGIGLNTLEDRFGIGRMSLWRHLKNHLTVEDRALYLADVNMRGLADRAHAESMTVMDYIAIERGIVMKSLQIAAMADDRPAVAALSGKLTDLLKLAANMSGQLHSLIPSQITNNIAVFTNSPAFGELQAMLVRALAGHPVALQRVMAGLEELDAKAASCTPPMIEARALEGTHADATA